MIIAFSGEAAELESMHATYTGAPVEIDGNLITADGPESAKEFGEVIVKNLH
ncbi:hypothetical protein ACFL52_02735 [Candidatus Margulisiibacteriota bacterium]